MLRSSAGDNMDVMTMMMQMEKLPQFCDRPFHDTPTYPAEIELSDKSTSSAATTPPIFHSSPNNVALPTLENSPASLPFMGNPTIQEPLIRPPIQTPVLSDQTIIGNNSSAGGLSLPNNIYDQKKNSSMAAMREMIFRIAAMQPIHIDPESLKPPKRRNVKISKDPQSVAARHRRERISERIRILQRLVPGGTKMDTASMLDEAIHYVKFLKRQVQTLEQARKKGTKLGVGFPFGMTNAINVVSYSSLAKACSNGAGVLYPDAQLCERDLQAVGFM